ncbi:MAG: FAD-binding oxidoreductase [Gammaproteobacteria bacterium]
MDAFEEKKRRLVRELGSKSGAPVGLDKTTSNLFRDRKGAHKRPLRAADFKEVRAVDANAGWVDVEGMATYAQLVDATLQHGVIPCVVPELKSITVGGAVAGVGIESSSFKYGLVHETVKEMEILVGDGRVLLCRPDNDYADLFFGFANSYGTLGYALRLKVGTVVCKPYVALEHIRYTNAETYFQDLETWCEKPVDFIDGVVFAPNELYLTVGRLVDEVPFTSDYTFEEIYYQSIREKQQDYLKTYDYLWRWDTDWFWCSKNLLAQHPFVRRIFGKSHLNSITYTKIMRWNSRWQLTRRLNQLFGIHSESVIQDVDIPLDNAGKFLDFFSRKIGILPIWICPARAQRKDHRFDMYSMDASKIYINFGFWDVIRGRKRLPKGFYNREVEGKVRELGGIKSLYSESFYEPEEFWQIYNGVAYERLKAKYDPQGALGDLYQKCVLGA